ncbi:MAG: hypothetical protein HYY37_06665 [Candidatus Aenigmarchaeota archaeon]|nr:hypothetical protein [Candidatus Aenigmarchaeota archaeon]
MPEGHFVTAEKWFLRPFWNRNLPPDIIEHGRVWGLIDYDPTKDRGYGGILYVVRAMYITEKHQPIELYGMK